MKPKNDLELVNGLAWYLECMHLAATSINNFRPPADLFQMRMHYSLYVVNLMSAVDMMREQFAGFSSELDK